MKILLTGASGFLGSALVPALDGLGHSLVQLSSQKRSGTYFWDQSGEGIPEEALEGLDAVIHLAGKSIDCVWTAKNKASIYNSRVVNTAILAKRLARLENPPKLVIIASGAHICPYLETEESPVSLSTQVGDSFLAQLVKEWELAAFSLSKANIRLIHLRTGVVMSPKGGMLKKILPLARYRLMPIFGSGEQFISWISLEDWVSIVLWCLEQPHLKGPINAVSPHPIRQIDFARLLAKKFHYRPYLGLPEAFLKGVCKQMAEELLLKSIYSQPKALIEAAFPFRFQRFEEYLNFSLA